MDFTALFRTFTLSAFRLECLQEYYVPREASAAKHFKQTGRLPEDTNTEWVEILEAAKTRHARAERLRLISTPPTWYERFEIEAAYLPGLRLGEDIRLVPRGGLPDSEDFWVFDDKWYAAMIYGPAGEFVRAEIRPVDTNLIAKIQFWRGVFQEQAERLTNRT